MPTSVKAFKLTSLPDLSDLSEKLSGWTEVQERKGFRLITNIENLALEANFVQGTLMRDVLRVSMTRTGPQTILATESYPFRVTSVGGNGFILTMSSRKKAYYVALRVLRPLDMIGEVEDCVINDLTSLGSDFRVVHISGLGGISKIVLSGHSVENSHLFKELSTKGRVTYVQFYDELIKSTVGINWDFSILIFSRISPGAAFDYLTGLLERFGC